MADYPFKCTKAYEGLELTVYADEFGNATVGWGHEVLPEDNLSEGDTITMQQAEDFYSHDYALAQEDAKELISSYPNQPQIVQLMLTDMVYNMGKRTFSEFQRTISAINNGQYSTAAADLKDSAWYGQVGQRSRDITDTFIQLGNT